MHLQSSSRSEKVIQRRESGSIDLRIESCTRIEDVYPCVQLQGAIWGYSEIERVPARTFAVAINIGGSVLIAHDGDVPIGFALAFPGRHEGIDHLHSNMVGVLPGYQGCGVGFQLKVKQREIALEKGFQRIEWTFDPLAIRNAHFNITRLGAIIRRVLPNAYGISASPLHGGMPTDRLVAEWCLSSRRVMDCLGGADAGPSMARPVRLVFPAAIAQIKEFEFSRALSIQTTLTEELDRYFSMGYVVSGFVLEPENAVYLLEPCETNSDCQLLARSRYGIGEQKS